MDIGRGTVIQKVTRKIKLASLSLSLTETQEKGASRFKTASISEQDNSKGRKRYFREWPAVNKHRT